MLVQLKLVAEKRLPQVPQPLRVCGRTVRVNMSVCVSYLLKDLAVRLHLILLAQQLSCAEAVSFRKVYYSIFKNFIQSIHTLVQQGRQPLLAVHGPVRPCRSPAYLMGQKIRMRSWGKSRTNTGSKKILKKIQKPLIA